MTTPEQIDAATAEYEATYRAKLDALSAFGSARDALYAACGTSRGHQSTDISRNRQAAAISLMDDIEERVSQSRRRNVIRIPSEATEHQRQLASLDAHLSARAADHATWDDPLTEADYG